MIQAFVGNVLPKLGFKTLLGMSRPPLWLSFDREGDAIHVIFEEAKKSDKTNLEKDDIIVTKRGKKVINITILN